ncbi:MAG TPA: winged helix DNA-binding domain-containing protein [Polyangia bacterium]|nr:winged helix DNA-binding domain-containing protein [Polyangia bacterium]
MPAALRIMASVDLKLVAARRLHGQLVSRQPLAAPFEVVAWFGAMQAQDYLASLWALGLRTAGANEAAVEAVLAEGAVLRTHGFRGTWQYVTRDDVRWMLGLVGQRVIASMASRLRSLDLDETTLERATELFARALEGGKQLTRREMAVVLERRRIAAGARLLHILAYAELRGIICSGARRGKQQTFALLDERAPKTRSLTREESLSKLARVYFQSRGPATARDLAWWSGLPLADARRSIELAKRSLQSIRVGEQECWLSREAVEPLSQSTVHLLPAFDECLIAYQDRSAFVDALHVREINDGGGILKPALLSAGRVAGTWRRTFAKQTVSIAVQPFVRLERGERAAISAAAHRYARFLGVRAVVSCGDTTANALASRRRI